MGKHFKVFILIISSLIANTPLFAKSKLFNLPTLSQLNTALSENTFYGVKGALYNSGGWTATAGIETRDYSWSMRWLKKVKLEWPNNLKITPYYKGKVPAYFYEGTNSKLVIILGPSFSSPKDGTWYSKIFNLILYDHPDTSFLIFPGYLEDENLDEALPSFADSGVRFVGADFTIRIAQFVSQKKLEGRAYSKVGLVGFSGGASILLRILQEDKRLRDRSALWPRNLFNWGNLSLSPVLSAVAASDTVDFQANLLESNKLVNIHNKIENWFVWKFIGSLFPWNKKVDATSLLERSKEPQEHSYEKLSNLVTYSVIHAIKNFSKKQTPEYKGEYRLDDYYRGFAFPKLKETYGNRIKMNYEDFSSFSDNAKIIDRPLTLVFSHDDPLLSVKTLIEPEAPMHLKNKSILALYRKNPNVRVEDNRWGGHMGYFLDTTYLSELISSTFK